MVLDADAIVDPWTVMIVAINAPVANYAVSGAATANNFALGA